MIGADPPKQDAGKVMKILPSRCRGKVRDTAQHAKPHLLPTGSFFLSHSSSNTFPTCHFGDSAANAA